jgi:hypothetical protein
MNSIPMKMRPGRVAYTAMHGMRPTTGEVRNDDACRCIVAAMMMDGFVLCRTIKTPSMASHTFVAVGTPDGHVTGVYEWVGGE